MKSSQRNGFSIKVLVWIAFAAIVVVNLLPFAWGAVTSVKSARELLSYPPKVAGFSVSWEHYAAVLKSNFGVSTLNSILYSLIAIVVCVFCATLAAYALTRYVFKGKRFLFYMILSGIPLALGSAAMVVPNYMLFSALGLVDKWYTLPLIYIAYGIPMATWIMVGGLQGVPISVEEAASIDGASKFYIIFLLIPRMCLPALACAALMTFIGAWNEFAVSSVLVSQQALYPIQVSIYNYLGYFGLEWGPLTASATIAVLPVLAMFTILGKMLISGLTAGAVKE